MQRPEAPPTIAPIVNDAPISRPEQLLDDPHLNATGGLADITLPDGERAGQTARTTLLPLAIDGQRLGVRLQPPVLGQHTADLMQELGYFPSRCRPCSRQAPWPESYDGQAQRAGTTGKQSPASP